MRALLLSNTSIQPLAGFLKPWEVTCGEFNSILLDLANPHSVAATGEFSHILCLHDSDAMMGDGWYGDGSLGQADAFLAALESFCAAHPEKIVVSNLFCFSSSRWLSFADVLHPLSLRTAETELNNRLINMARRYPSLLLVDLEILFRRYGEDTLLSEPFWYLGRIRYSNQMFRALAGYLQQAVRAYSNKNRKVLILDLDDTLWGGILGEAGPLGISLSEDQQGRCYRDFQRAIKAVQRTGILLAIASKNNPDDVEQVFERNPMMILRREDFACIQTNWDPKPQSILDIAETLNLGVDSFVFLDDNPVERELVASAVPGIAVPEFPQRPEKLSTWFLREIVPAYFGRYTLTAEDTAKTTQYRANQERRQLARALDFDGFLRDLRIECLLKVDPLEQVNRIAQLSQKTNQFNLTTRRYEIPQIRHFIESAGHAVLLLDYADRFGSEGSVGLAILDYSESRIDTFLMSCRVIGREVEEKMLEKVYALFREHGLNRIVGEFIPTAKNQQVASFYETHGFALMCEQTDGRKTYERILA